MKKLENEDLNLLNKLHQKTIELECEIQGLKIDQAFIENDLKALHRYVFCLIVSFLAVLVAACSLGDF